MVKIWNKLHGEEKNRIYFVKNLMVFTPLLPCGWRHVIISPILFTRAMFEVRMEWMLTLFFSPVCLSSSLFSFWWRYVWNEWYCTIIIATIPRFFYCILFAMSVGERHYVTMFTEGPIIIMFFTSTILLLRDKALKGSIREAVIIIRKGIINPTLLHTSKSSSLIQESCWRKLRSGWTGNGIKLCLSE